MDVLELSNKYFFKAIIKILQWAITNTFEANEKTKILSKERKDIKRSQMGILKLKNIMTKIKKFSGWVRKPDEGDKQKKQWTGW